jgi:hypothetical protein
MIPAEAPSPSEANMPHAPMPVASASAAPSAAPVADEEDAGAPVERDPHAVLVTSCAIDRNGCLAAQPTSPQSEASYRVAYGRGGGTIRTRQQAMAELYKEIRDRMDSGAHLVAVPHHLGDPVPTAGGAEASRPRAHKSDDPVIEAAFQLMDVVDHDGEIAIDALATAGSRSCKLSLGNPESDGGVSRCLVEAPASMMPTQRSRGQ